MLKPRGLALCLLLLCLPSGACSSIGFGTQRSVEAAGVAATAAVATPVIGFASWPLWHWLANPTATWLTGTVETERIPKPAPPTGSGHAPQDAAAILVSGNDSMNLYVIILLLVGGALGRELWSLKAKDKEQQKQLDELWDMFTRGRK